MGYIAILYRRCRVDEPGPGSGVALRRWGHGFLLPGAWGTSCSASSVLLGSAGAAGKCCRRLSGWQGVRSATAPGTGVLAGGLRRKAAGRSGQGATRPQGRREPWRCRRAPPPSLFPRSARGRSGRSVTQPPSPCARQSKGLIEPSLGEHSVRRVPRLYVGVHREVLAGNRAEPDFMVPASLTHPLAACIPQFPLKRPGKAGHYPAKRIVSNLLDVMRNGIASSTGSSKRFRLSS